MLGRIPNPKKFATIVYKRRWAILFTRGGLECSVATNWADRVVGTGPYYGVAIPAAATVVIAATIATPQLLLPPLPPRPPALLPPGMLSPARQL